MMDIDHIVYKLSLLTENRDIGAEELRKLLDKEEEREKNCHFLKE